MLTSISWADDGAVVLRFDGVEREVQFRGGSHVVVLLVVSCLGLSTLSGVLASVIALRC